MLNNKVAIFIACVLILGAFSCAENRLNESTSAEDKLTEVDLEAEVTTVNENSTDTIPKTFIVDGLEIPVPSSLPNLKPGWLWETDGPIIISKKSDTFLDETPLVGSKVFIDIVVFNGTLIPIESDFVVDIFFDEQKIYTVTFEGPTPPTGFRVSTDIMSELFDSFNVISGEHVLKLHIDPDNSIEESNESDNLFEKTFIWSEDEVQFQAKTKYTNDELKKILSSVPELMRSNLSVVSEGQSLDVEQVINIADAGIFMLTGVSILDQRIRIQILSRQDYANRLDSTFNDLFALNDGTDFLALARERDFQKKYSLGKKDRLNGMVDVMVDGSNKFDVVISTLVHELAHALQDIIAPWQTEGVDPNNNLELMAIREAQAQQFERAFWLAINEVTGENLLRFNYTKARDEYIKFNSLLDSTAGYYQHDLGRAIQWLAVLNDEKLKNLKAELLKEGQLSYKSGFELFEYFLTLKTEDTTTYVRELLYTFDDYSADIVTLQKKRLVDIEEPRYEEYPALENVGLLMP